MNKIDLASLNLLIAAIEENSITKAAERENLVTSAASKRLSMLEARVGTTLLRRHGRGVVATPAGDMLYQRAKAILRSVHVAESALSSYSLDGQSKIRLVANPTTLIQWLPPVISSFAKQFPTISIDLMEALSKEIPLKVANGDADIGIYHAPSPHSGLVSVPFRKDRVALVVPQGHPLEGRDPLRLEDTLEFDYVGYFPLHSIEDFIVLAGGTMSRPPVVKTQVSNVEARCLMVKEGLGIALVPEAVARTYAGPLNLRLLTLNEEWAERQFYLCVRDLRTLHSSAQDLFESLKTYSDEPYQ
jgi:DNA-binding transcriptional LysR family regulator